MYGMQLQCENNVIMAWVNKKTGPLSHMRTVQTEIGIPKVVSGTYEMYDGPEHPAYPNRLIESFNLLKPSGLVYLNSLGRSISCIGGSG